ncbi:MAG: hypothetical protein AAFV49_23845, partial [Pseudomonadota bacterium]
MVTGRRVAPLGPLDAMPGRQRRRLATALRRGRAVLVLGLPAGRVVRRRVALPLAAAEDLEGVLAYEFDRLTPFRRDEVHVHATIARRRTDSGRLDVDLAFAPRAALAPFRAALAAAGLAPLSRIDILDAGGRPAGLNLLAREE